MGNAHHVDRVNGNVHVDEHNPNKENQINNNGGVIGANIGYNDKHGSINSTSYSDAYPVTVGDAELDLGLTLVGVAGLVVRALFERKEEYNPLPRV